MPNICPPPEMIKALAGQDGVVAGFTTRKGGVSEPPFDSLNLAVSSGDDADCVAQNRSRLLASVGFPENGLAIAGQVHGTSVEVVAEPGLVRNCDGLVTRARGLLLGIVAADCAVVLVADARAGCVGAAHAGWRGAVGIDANGDGIIPVLTDQLRALGASLPRCQAFVSPCISQRHFEVGPEVADRFPPEFVTTHVPGGRPHVDLGGYLVSMLERSGVPTERIERDKRCTYADSDLFFSYRAASHAAPNTPTGRMMGFIGLTPRP